MSGPWERYGGGSPGPWAKYGTLDNEALDSILAKPAPLSMEQARERQAADDAAMGTQPRRPGLIGKRPVAASVEPPLDRPDFGPATPVVSRTLTDSPLETSLRKQPGLVIQPDRIAGPQLTNPTETYDRPAASPGSIAKGLATDFSQGLMRQGLGIIQQTLESPLNPAGVAINAILPDAAKETINDTFTDLRQRSERVQQSRRPTFESKAEELIYDGFSNTLQMIPGVAAAIVTRNPNIAIGAAAGQTEADAYGKYRARGATPQEAAMGAGLEGAFEAIGEKIPMGTFVDKFGKQGAKRLIGNFLLQEMATEQATTLAQDAVDTAIANPDKTWGDYVAERPEAALQTAVAVGVMGGTFGAAHHAILIGDRMGQRRAETQRGRVIANAAAVDAFDPNGGSVLESLATGEAPTFRRRPVTVPGVREQSVADALSNITPEDEASPLDTADIVHGRAVQADVAASRQADGALGQMGMPTVGTRVVIDDNGVTKTGTMSDWFDAQDGSGVVVDLDDGKPWRAYHDDMNELGIQIRPFDPTAEADAIDQRLAQLAAEPDAGVPTPLPPAMEPPATQATPPSRSGDPVKDGGAVIRSIFGDKARVTSGYRGPDHPLSKKNPKSWHARSHAAVDMAPIPGMTFEQARASIEAKGFHLIEALNEVGKGRTKHATGDHWHFVIGEGGGPTSRPAGTPAIADAAPTDLAAPERDEAPDFTSAPEPVAAAEPDVRVNPASLLEANPPQSEGGDSALPPTLPPPAADVAGQPLDADWTAFAPETGTLAIPRAEMPQIKAEHRGAMVNFMDARGIAHAEETVDPDSLKPSQAEFSSAKVQKAMDREGGDRAILVSADNHVIDGHHQWLAAREKGEPIRVIRLDAPASDVIAAAHEFPSSTIEDGAEGVAPPVVTTSSQSDNPPELSRRDTVEPAPGQEAAAAPSPTPPVEAPSAVSPTSSARIEQTSTGKSIAVFDLSDAEIGAIRAAGIPAVPVRRDGALVYAKIHEPAIRAALDSVAPNVPAPAMPIRTAPQSIETNDVAITPAGREVPVEYAVADLADLVTSHTEDGAVNPAFPAALQPRDRARGTSQAQIAEIAAKLDPRLLGRSIKASDGAPIVSPEGVVESGNGRTLALARAYRMGGERIAAYRQFLTEQGFNTEGVEQPVLVRVRRGEMAPQDVEAFTREANQRDTAGFSATEQAASDAKAMPAHVMDLYRGGDIDAAGNREFVRKFMGAVVPATEHSSMIAADGAMSQDAVRRITSALMHRAYDSPAIVAKMAESTDSNIKAISGALADVAGTWAKLRTAAAEGRINPAMDITRNLTEAVELVDRARREGVKVADLVNQRDIFSGDVVAARTEAVLRLMFRNSGLTQPFGRQKLAEQLNWYAEQAMLSSADAGLFGAAEQTTPDELIAGARERFGERDAGQGDLLAVRPGDAGDGGRVREGEQARDGDREGLLPETGGEGAEAELTPEPAQPAGNIEDFGEKLEGARKDTWLSYAQRLQDAQSLDAKSEPLSKLWPEPDYQKLIDNGADPYAVAAVRAVRDAIPNRPRSYGVVAWAQQVEAFRQFAMDMIGDAEFMGAARAKLTNEYARSLRDLQGAIDLYLEVGHDRSLKGLTFRSQHYGLYRGEQNVTKWVVEQRAKATAFSNWPREIAVADTREEALAKFRALLAAGGLDPKKKSEIVRFDIYSRRGEAGFIIGKKIGKEHVDLKRFETAKEARDFKVSDEGYAELVKALDQFKDIPPERKEVNSPRIGVNHRNGVDATPDMFADAFGFRGVQFGNYVEPARRQADLNQAYDALMDLAGVLGIPSKALSLNGSLGLAFGARGKGGKGAAAAHYETGNVVINLTKGAGAGSLAHEWWHSLDNYFSRSRNDPLSYLTDKPYARGEGVRLEMVEAFAGVMRAIKSTGLQERSRNLDKRRTKKYWSTDIEMSARAFESYVIAKLQDEQFSNDYLANIVPEKAFRIEEGYPYLTAPEVPAVRAAYDEFFRTVETEQTDKGVRLYSIPERTNLPTVSVDVSDWGRLPSSGYDRFQVLRGRVKRWYRSLLGTTVTSSDGHAVGFESVGMGKTVSSSGENLMLAARAIPKIIERGTPLGALPGDREGIRAWHRYAANVRVDGEVMPLMVFVRETVNGKFHYSLHHFRPEASDAPVGTGGDTRKAIAPAMESGAEDALNLFPVDAGRKAATASDAVALQARLESYGIARKVALRIVDTLNGAAGEYRSALIRVATDTSQNGRFTLDHEVIHALRDLGLFNASEWAILAAKAKRDPALMRSIRQRYPKLDAEAQIEEAVADMFARYQRGDYRAEGTVARVFKALRQALEAMRNWLAGNGARAAEGVMGDVARGDVGARQQAESGDAAKHSIPEPLARTEAPFEREGRPNPGISGGPVHDLLDHAGSGSIDVTFDKLDAVRENLQDRMLSVLRTQQAITDSLNATINELQDAYLAESLYSGRAGRRIEQLYDERVEPLMQAMHDEGVSLDELETYLYARHAPERNAAIAKINEAFADGGSGMTDIEARAIMSRIKRDGRAEVMEALAGYVDTIRDEALQARVDSGLISQEEAMQWRGTYKHYVPLRGRAEVDGEVATTRRITDRARSQSGMSVRGKESRRAFGRRSLADSILAYSILQAEEAIVRSEKNLAAKAFLRLAEANPDPEFWQVDKVNRVPVPDPVTGMVRYENQTRLTFEDAPYTVSAKVDGIEHRVTMNRDNDTAVRVAEAMRNLGGPQFGTFMTILSRFGHYFSAINTRYSPKFIATNAVRDMLTASLTLQQFEREMPGITARVARDYALAFAAKKDGPGDWTRWRREWEFAGGKVYFNDMRDLDQIKKDIVLRARMKAGAKTAAAVWKNTFRWIEETNDAVERGVRLAVFKNAREMGKSPAQAAFMARNVTVDFGRKGKWGPYMNAVFPFFNASVQGSTTLIKAMRSPRARIVATGWIAAGIAMAIANAATSGDDEDGQPFWDKIPMHEKAKNLIFMIPGGDDGSAIKIPLAYGINGLFSLGQNAVAVATGKMKPMDAAATSLLQFYDAFSPIQSGDWKTMLAPTFLDPFIEIDDNADFTGKPVQPKQSPYEVPKPDSENYYDRSAWAKPIAKAFNALTGGDEVVPGAVSISPDTIAHFAKFLTGGAGRFVLDAADLVMGGDDPEAGPTTVRDVPIVNAFATEKSPWVDKTLYWERVKQVKEVTERAKRYQEMGNAEGLDAYVDENRAVGEMAGLTKQADKAMAAQRKIRNAASFQHRLGEMDDEAYADVVAEVRGEEDRIVALYNRLWNERVLKDDGEGTE